MESYTSHKQTIIIAILCIIVVGGMFVYAKGGIGGLVATKSSQNSQIDGNIAVTTTRENKPISSTSTDWRRSFFTGTSTSIVKSTISTPSNESLTLTDTFGRDFFARYIQLKQSGLRDNQQFVADTLNNSIDKAADSAKKARVYTGTDITVQPVANSENLKVYGNAVGTIFSKYGVDEDPATVANDAFEKGDMTLLKGLDPIVASYETIVAMLKNTPVPQPLSVYHLNMINAESSMAQIARDLRHVETDPMQAIVSIQQYSAAQTSLIGALRAMKAYFSLVPVSFAPTEPGSLFSLNL